jgi:hypothetical protein
MSERSIEVDRAPLEGGVVVDGLRRAAKEIEHAARSEGIEEGGPLGIFVAAQSGALSRMAALLEDTDRRFAKHVGNVHEAIGAVGRVGETELEKVREMRKAVEVLMEQARVAIREKDSNYNEAFKRQVQNIGNRMLDEFGSWRVIKQDAWNHRSRRKSALFFCMVTLLIFGAGYGIREWEDRGIIQTGAARHGGCGDGSSAGGDEALALWIVRGVGGGREWV